MNALSLVVEGIRFERMNRIPAIADLANLWVNPLPQPSVEISRAGVPCDDHGPHAFQACASTELA